MDLEDSSCLQAAIKSFTKGLGTDTIWGTCAQLVLRNPLTALYIYFFENITLLYIRYGKIIT